MNSRNKWCAISTRLICFFFMINLMITPASQASLDIEPSEDMHVVSSLSPELGAVDMPQDLQGTTHHIIKAVKILLLK